MNKTLGQIALEIPPRRNRHLGRSEVISHDRALEAALRLIHSHFGNTPHAKIHIPADIDDDDIVISEYIEQQRQKENEELARRRAEMKRP